MSASCFKKGTMNITQISVVYLLAMTLITFILFGVDKLKAKKDMWRIPESTLLWFAVAGGSIGALLGMKVWHHKTLHKKFSIGVPAILVVQVALLLYLLFRK